MNNNKKDGMRTIDLAYIAICSVLIVICSWLTIPTIVPFTLQTFAVFFVLRLLGGKRGTLSVIVYILLAAAGLPVLSGFLGGIGALLGLTGGYILGFIFMGLIYMIGETIPIKNKAVPIASMVIGLLVCYTFGTAWFMIVYARKTGPIGIGSALLSCVIPFVIPDIIKLVLAIVLAERLRRILPDL